MSERPVIGFLTDFGLDGAAAICRGVMLSIARDAQIVDISHTVAKYAIPDGAYLLASAVPWLPIGVHVAVVDPGVGTDRRPIGLLTARGDVLIGPDNGLLLPAAGRLGGVIAARLLANREWFLPATSATFHGRDIFAPVAAHLAIGESFGDVGPAVDQPSLVRLDVPSAKVENGRLDTGVTYVDSFGNVRLAGGAAELVAALGPIELCAEIIVATDPVASGSPATGSPATGSSAPAARATWQRTFGEATTGDLLVYEDSSGNLAIAVSNGDAARRLRVSTGARISIRRG
jgi:S-adenosylmethionine hydrolase